jgi:hypothetical protein
MLLKIWKYAPFHSGKTEYLTLHWKLHLNYMDSSTLSLKYTDNYEYHNARKLWTLLSRGAARIISKE